VGYFQYCHYGDYYYHLWLTKICGGLWGWIELFVGMGEDGSESVRGWVRMGVKSAGMGRDGTKIPSPCTPLLCTVRSVPAPGHNAHLIPFLISALRILFARFYRMLPHLSFLRPYGTIKKVKVVHTRLPSIGFRS